MLVNPNEALLLKTDFCGFDWGGVFLLLIPLPLCPLTWLLEIDLPFCSHER
jgi:hypothetical protein